MGAFTFNKQSTCMPLSAENQAFLRFQTKERRVCLYKITYVCMYIYNEAGSLPCTFFGAFLFITLEKAQDN